MARPTQGASERSIESSLSAICTAIDNYDVDAFLMFFAQDAQVDFGGRYCGSVTGFISSVIEARDTTLAMQHRLDQIKINFSNDMNHATSKSVVYADVTRVSDHLKQRRLVQGQYRDQWIFTEGKWQIKNRSYRQIAESSI